MLRFVRFVVGLGCLSGFLGSQAAPLHFSSVTLNEDGPVATLNLLRCPGTAPRHPVILMLGALESNAPPGVEHKPPPGRLDALRLFRSRMHPILILRNGRSGWSSTNDLPTAIRLLRNAPSRTASALSLTCAPDRT
jgi:hypothetical protein